MKTNIIPTLGKRFAKLLPLCLLTALTACDRDDVESVDFNVRLENPEALYAGTPITFVFDGNPDYISFYSGERNNRYDNHNRTKMELDSLGLSHTVVQQYSDPVDYLGKRILRLMISEDYDGSGTPEAVEAATWRDLSDPEVTGSIEVPVPDKIGNDGTRKEVLYSAIDLTEYKDKKFYLAYRYLAGPHPGTRYADRPRIDITNLQLVKREPDKNLISITDMQNEFAFTTVHVSSQVTSTFSINKANLMFQPKEVENEITPDYDMDVWMISQKLIPQDVEPDRGTPIKGTNARLPLYQHTYSEPGTYTATFIVTNANKWNSTQVVRDITFEVKAH